MRPPRCIDARPILGKLRQLWATRPLLANSATGWALFAAGDVVSQAAPAAWGPQGGAEVPARRDLGAECAPGGVRSVDWGRAAKVRYATPGRPANICNNPCTKPVENEAPRARGFRGACMCVCTRPRKCTQARTHKHVQTHTLRARARRCRVAGGRAGHLSQRVCPARMVPRAGSCFWQAARQLAGGAEQSARRPGRVCALCLRVLSRVGVCPPGARRQQTALALPACVLRGAPRRSSAGGPAWPEPACNARTR